MIPLVEAGPWRVLYRAGGAGLVVAFASVGRDPALPPAPEFARASVGKAALFVIDAARTWGRGAGFAEVLGEAMRRVRAQKEVGRVLALGASMGGFAALAGAKALGADAVMAIGPQFAPAAAWEGRWRAFTAGLPEDWTAPLPEGVAVTLLHGMADDAAQALAFPQRRGVDQVLFEGISHSDLGPHLRALGLLPGLIDAALMDDRRRLLRLTAAAGGVRRR